MAAPNPNNCEACDHKKTQDIIEKNDPQDVKLHCYMFRDVPTEVCMQHTTRQITNFPIQTFSVAMVERLRAQGLDPKPY